MKGVFRPVRHPPRWGYDVIRASRLLSAEQKHVWRIVNEFDTQAGCWAAQTYLAQLVGMSAADFVSHLNALIALGLIREANNGSAIVFFATIPAEFPASATLATAEKIALAVELDAVITKQAESLGTAVPKSVPKAVLPAVPESFSNKVPKTMSSSLENKSPKGAIPRGGRERPTHTNLDPRTAEILERCERKKASIRDAALC